MLFGENQAASILLKILNIEKSDIPRFRDCFLNDGFIIIHTHTGGGNRDFYDEPNEENLEGPWNTTLKNNMYFVRDEDDDFDSTYANFYFSFPDEYKDDLDALSKGTENYKPSEKWQMVFEAIKSNN